MTGFVQFFWGDRVTDFAVRTWDNGHGNRITSDTRSNDTDEHAE